jgi:prolyl oligopeptidase
VIDTLHGVEIEDPFRWLEDAESAESRAWVEAQNAHTRSILDAIPGRDAIRSQFEQILAVGLVGVPAQRDNRLFYTMREPGENQIKLLFRDALDGDDRVVCDPNALDPSGITAIDWWHPSWDGRFVAYGLSHSGDEQSTLHLYDCQNRRPLDDTIPFTRFASVAWLADSSGFYYTSVIKTLDDPGNIASYYHRAVYLHVLGRDHMDDQEIFPDDADPATQPAVVISRDGRLLIVWVHRGANDSRLFLRRLDEGQEDWTEITAGLQGNFIPIPAGGRLYLCTNYKAPRYRLVEIDPARPQHEHWETIVDERLDATLVGAVRAGGRFALHYLVDAHSQLVLADAIPGAELEELPLPEMCTVSGIGGSSDSDNLFFGVETFDAPSTVYRSSVSRGGRDVWRYPPGWNDLDPVEIVTDQAWYASKDGTKVSMFIVRRSDVTPSTETPLMLTGYGGFNLPKLPAFEPGWHGWVRLGGIFAIANLRGGSEYGEEWHQAGMLDRKQNVFDDFIAAAEYLIEQKYTSPQRLAIMGRSNGGLLVGAAMTQRPELFRVVECGVPLLDMLRYHRFLIAKLWIPEYGSAEDPGQFEYLHAYSPYHHVHDDVEYPAVLFYATACDSRVDPLHARKMTALMQTRAHARGPVILRLESEAGHGVGKPVSKLIDQLTDHASFLAWQTGLIGQ